MHATTRPWTRPPRARGALAISRRRRPLGSQAAFPSRLFPGGFSQSAFPRRLFPGGFSQAAFPRRRFPGGVSQSAFPSRRFPVGFSQSPSPCLPAFHQPVEAIRNYLPFVLHAGLRLRVASAVQFFCCAICLIFIGKFQKNQPWWRCDLSVQRKRIGRLQKYEGCRISKLGFRAAKQKLVAALDKGDYLHAARSGNLNSKNLLMTGQVSAEQISNIVKACQGQDYTSAPLHNRPTMEVHILKRDGWYIKFYFLETPSVMFISVHQ